MSSAPLATNLRAAMSLELDDVEESQVEDSQRDMLVATQSSPTPPSSRAPSSRAWSKKLKCSDDLAASGIQVPIDVGSDDGEVHDPRLVLEVHDVKMGSARCDGGARTDRKAWPPKSKAFLQRLLQDALANLDAGDTAGCRDRLNSMLETLQDVQFSPVSEVQEPGAGASFSTS